MPGYCGAQDTFYVGTLKGVGRVYQQTFIDAYAKGRLCQAVRPQNPDHRRLSSDTHFYEFVNRRGIVDRLGVGLRTHMTGDKREVF
jgi:hypothetical protein